MHYYWLTLASLAVWRITHLLAVEDGPWRLFGNLRDALGSRGWDGAVRCFYCLSLWVAAPFAYAVGDSWLEKLMLLPALSAAAIFMERLTSRQPDGEPPPATYFEAPFETPFETPEDPDVLLRSDWQTAPGATRTR